MRRKSHAGGIENFWSFAKRRLAKFNGCASAAFVLHLKGYALATKFQAVQEILGHKDIQTTVRYTHVQTEHIAKEYRKYHPREHDLFEAVDEEYEKRLESLEENS